LIISFVMPLQMTSLTVATLIWPVTLMVMAAESVCPRELMAVSGTPFPSEPVATAVWAFAPLFRTSTQMYQPILLKPSGVELKMTAVPK
jgi:hypothetical protein